MKTLCQEEMISVSGAGSLEDAILYTSYDDFGDYLVFMDEMKMDPLGVKGENGQSIRGLMPAYTAWCKNNGFAPEYLADAMGWKY